MCPSSFMSAGRRRPACLRAVLHSFAMFWSETHSGPAGRRCRSMSIGRFYPAITSCRGVTSSNIAGQLIESSRLPPAGNSRSVWKRSRARQIHRPARAAVYNDFLRGQTPAKFQCYRVTRPLAPTLDHTAFMQHCRAPVRLPCSPAHPIRGLLTLNTARGPGNQCGLHLAQKGGLAVHGANREIAFRRVLDLLRLVRTFLDGDTIPSPQHPNQFGFFSFEDALEFAGPAKQSLHREHYIAREGPE